MIPNMQYTFKERPTVDVRGIHLQKCKRLHRETIKTHDILNEKNLLRVESEQQEKRIIKRRHRTSSSSVVLQAFEMAYKL